MPSSACDADNLLLHSFPTRRSSDLHFVPCGQLVPSCPLFLSMAAYSRKGNCTGLAKDFLLLLYQTYLQEALSFCSSQSEPSSNNTLVNTKAPPPPCSKLMSARSHDSFLVAPSLLSLFQPNSRIGRLSSKSQWYHLQCSVASARAALKTSPTIFFPLTFLMRVFTPPGSNFRNPTGHPAGAPGLDAVVCAPATGQNKSARTAMRATQLQLMPQNGRQRRSFANCR